MNVKSNNIEYNLEERTARFGEAVLQFVKKIPRNPVNDPLISQIVRSGTSIGANYCEANNSVSKKEFRNKIGFCRKESEETKHWLRMITSANEGLKPEARKLWQEANELNLIFLKYFEVAPHDLLFVTDFLIRHSKFDIQSKFKIRHSKLKLLNNINYIDCTFQENIVSLPVYLACRASV